MSILISEDIKKTRDEDPTFFFHGSGSGSAEKKIQIRIWPEIEMKKKMYLYFSKVGIKFDIMNLLTDLYFVQDKNNFINKIR